ncbi:hypothetical protein [Methylobacterium nonmethylotrophicum]|uniref:Uncharacterized protein n=1 Tax=Methylobacterium nonmethylotrophicum TaxID=1141884 RepID=A0A4Z0NRF5_9HYPH|nr:hypothetical protein [Methylobacterium nonmethylotrophicum]TGD99020.1 hypothetical protein EU555_14035 [Methylobacterium nonmethylotrophicum]
MPRRSAATGDADATVAARLRRETVTAQNEAKGGLPAETAATWIAANRATDGVAEAAAGVLAA